MPRRKSSARDVYKGFDTDRLATRAGMRYSDLDDRDSGLNDVLTSTKVVKESRQELTVTSTVEMQLSLPGQ